MYMFHVNVAIFVSKSGQIHIIDRQNNLQVSQRYFIDR